MEFPFKEMRTFLHQAFLSKYFFLVMESFRLKQEAFFYMHLKGNSPTDLGPFAGSPFAAGAGNAARLFLIGQRHLAQKRIHGLDYGLDYGWIISPISQTWNSWSRAEKKTHHSLFSMVVPPIATFIIGLYLSFFNPTWRLGILATLLGVLRCSVKCTVTLGFLTVCSIKQISIDSSNNPQFSGEWGDKNRQWNGYLGHQTTQDLLTRNPASLPFRFVEWKGQKSRYFREIPEFTGQVFGDHDSYHWSTGPNGACFQHVFSHLPGCRCWLGVEEITHWRLSSSLFFYGFSEQKAEFQSLAISPKKQMANCLFPFKTSIPIPIFFDVSTRCARSWLMLMVDVAVCSVGSKTFLLRDEDEHMAL